MLRIVQRQCLFFQDDCKPSIKNANSTSILFVRDLFKIIYDVFEEEEESYRSGGNFIVHIWQASRRGGGGCKSILWPCDFRTYLMFNICVM